MPNFKARKRRDGSVEIVLLETKREGLDIVMAGPWARKNEVNQVLKEFVRSFAAAVSEANKLLESQ